MTAVVVGQFGAVRSDGVEPAAEVCVCVDPEGALVGGAEVGGNRSQRVIGGDGSRRVSRNQQHRENVEAVNLLGAIRLELVSPTSAALLPVWQSAAERVAERPTDVRHPPCGQLRHTTPERRARKRV